MINCAGGAKIQGCVYLPETGLNYGIVFAWAVLTFAIGILLLEYFDDES